MECVSSSALVVAESLVASKSKQLCSWLAVLYLVFACPHELLYAVWVWSSQTTRPDVFEQNVYA
jgi:hypothetical protein